MISPVEQVAVSMPDGSIGGRGGKPFRRRISSFHLLDPEPDRGELLILRATPFDRADHFQASRLSLRFRPCHTKFA